MKSYFHYHIATVSIDSIGCLRAHQQSNWKGRYLTCADKPFARQPGRLHVYQVDNTSPTYASTSSCYASWFYIHRFAGSKCCSLLVNAEPHITDN